MGDDQTLKGPQERSRINLQEDYEVRYWTQKFGVSVDKLKATIDKVGNSVRAVQNELVGND